MYPKLLAFILLISLPAGIIPVMGADPAHFGSLSDAQGGALLLNPASVFVSGNYAYLTTAGTGLSPAPALEIVDISDPANPVHVGSIDGMADPDLGWREPYSLYVSGNYAYIGTDSNGLHIIDVSNAAAPVQRGTVYDSGGGTSLQAPVSVFVSGSYAYVASRDSDSLDVIDISDPDAPFLESQFSIPVPLSVYVSGIHAYVTSDFGSLNAMDISDPSSPGLTDLLDDGGGFEPYLINPYSVCVSGNFAYVASGGWNCLEIVDISDPASMTHEGFLSDGTDGANLQTPYSVCVSNDLVYVASSAGNAIEVADVSAPTAPVHHGLITDGGGSTPYLLKPRSVAVSDDTVFIASYSSGALEIAREPPAIVSITPDSADNTGPVSITDLAGTSFRDGAVVNLTQAGSPDIVATSVVRVSDTQITCTFPISGASGGLWTVSVKNPDGLTGTMTDGFTITDLRPTVTSVTPNSADNTGPVSITDLEGTGFQAGATVRLEKTGYADITATGFTVDSDTHITCTFPITSAAGGTWNVIVENPDGLSGTLTDGFTVNDLFPTISSITPSSGINSGPVSITSLAGTNFQAGATVTLTHLGYPDIPATGVSIIPPTQITCSLPITGANIGEWTITVRNPDGLSGTLLDGFTIIPAPSTPTATPTPAPIRTITVTPTPAPVLVPRIISVEPPFSEEGNSSCLLAIKGMYFQPTSRILWNGVDIKVLSASFNEIIAELPGSNRTHPGMFIITVLNPGSGCCSFDTIPFNVTPSGPTVSLASSPPMIQGNSEEGTLVTLFAKTVPYGLSRYSLSIVLQNQSVGNISEAAAPSWATDARISTDIAGAIHINGSDEGNLIRSNALSTSLGSFRITGKNAGKTNISCILEELFLDDGTSCPQSSRQIPITFSSLVNLPGPNNTYTIPRDTDNDGKYEDLNGNGLFDLDDIILCFNELDFIRANEPSWLFDYDANGAINYNDVVRLFQRYLSVQ